MQEPTVTLVPPTAGLEELIAKAKAFAQSSKAPATHRAMKSDFKDFENWESQHYFPTQTTPPVPEVIALYLADRASTLSPQTLTRRLTAISLALRASGYDGPSPASTKHPLVGAVLRGIRRTKGVAPGPNQKDPLLTAQVKQLVSTCGNSLRDKRDRALILTGFAGGGIRRAQLAAIDLSSLEFREDSGVIYHAGRSKTDQEGIGRKVGIPWGADPETCPVRALAQWLEASCIRSGPVFRAINQRGRIAETALNPASVNLIVKRSARLAGLNAEALGAHSLRSGFCTQASFTMSDRAIMKQSGHKTSKSLDRYVRIAGLFAGDVAGSLGI